MKFFDPDITEHEIQAMADCLRRGHLATGVPAAEFERCFGEKFGYPHVVAVNSGTSALIAALHCLGVVAGDEVIVTAYSIMATANCILALGAVPVFCDIDRDTYNMDPSKLAELVTANTRAALPASIFGVPVDMKGIRGALPPRVKILEDTIEALGSTRHGQPVGLDADACCFGFFPNKQITTCQGGVVCTEDPDLAGRVRAFRQHGYGNNPTLWDQGYGWNIRLPDPLAAMGIVQVERMSEMQHRLNEVASWYDRALLYYRKQHVPAWANATHFIYGVELPYGVDKFDFCMRMAARDVPIRPYFNAMHRVKHVEKFYRQCPVADEVGSRTVALPFHTKITYDDVLRVAEIFEEEAR